MLLLLFARPPPSPLASRVVDADLVVDPLASPHPPPPAAVVVPSAPPPPAAAVVSSAPPPPAASFAPSAPPPPAAAVAPQATPPPSDVVVASTPVAPPPSRLDAIVSDMAQDLLKQLADSNLSLRGILADFADAYVPSPSPELVPSSSTHIPATSAAPSQSRSDASSWWRHGSAQDSPPPPSASLVTIRRAQRRASRALSIPEDSPRASTKRGNPDSSTAPWYVVHPSASAHPAPIAPSLRSSRRRLCSSVRRSTVEDPRGGRP